MVSVLIVLVGFLVVAVVMEALKDMHKRSLAHAERMKELQIEELRVQASLPPGQYPALTGTSDTMIHRGPDRLR